MALFRWYGDGAGVKTDWDDGRNWRNGAGAFYAAGVYPGVVPGQYDDVIFDTALTGTMESVAGYDAPGAGEEVLASFRVGPDYDGDIGSLGAFLDIEVSHDTDAEIADSVVNIDGEECGDIFLDGGGTYGLRRVTVTASKGTTSIIGKAGAVSLQKGIVVLGGSVSVLTISDSFYVGYQYNPRSDVTLTINDTVTLPSSITVTGGIVENNVAITTLILRGGNWTQVAGDITNLYLYNVANFLWDAGDIGYMEIHGGSVNATSDSSVGREFTIAKVYQNGTLDLRNDLGNNTVAQGGYIEIHDGTVNFNYGQKVLPIP